MKAAESGIKDNVINLLRAGCNPFLQDLRGLRADHYAEINHPDKDIHTILRMYMQEIEEGNLEDVD